MFLFNSLKTQKTQQASPWRQRLLGFVMLFAMALSLGATATLSGCGWINVRQASDPTPLATNLSEEAHDAIRVYQEAWHVVLEDYVDPTFNHQDWYRWKDRYKNQITDADDAYVAVQTMLASLNDQFTRFLNPRDMNEQTISIDSKLYGIGVQIAMKDGKLVVMTTFEETPAENAGLMAGDIITHIDGEETAGLSVEQAADRIRGERGTPVALSIMRGADETFDSNIVRDEIKIKSVFTREMTDKRIGYIRLSSFISETAINEMSIVMQDVLDKEAVILDLRENSGGLLSNAVEIADMFLEKGDIVSIVDRKKERRVYESNPGNIIKTPVVVLIDGGTASASEILSGALKDNDRAALIGTQTFGKGLVQKINPLMDGSGLNITISKYFTPDGTDINKKGISPDVTISFTKEDIAAHKDVQLEKAIEYIQSKYLKDSKKTASR